MVNIALISNICIIIHNMLTQVLDDGVGVVEQEEGGDTIVELKN